MKKHLKIIFFILLSLIQLAIPAQMILGREKALNNGEIFKFRIEPVDPVDNFRGNYLIINFNDNKIPAVDSKDYVRNQTVYAFVENDGDGFTHFTSVSPAVPRRGNYIRTKVLYSDNEAVYIKIPFDRYYMAEDKAKLAEEVYNKSLRNRKDVYVSVRIYDGDAAVDGLYIDGERIENYLRNQ
ncbi:GDYXXLXY domain-containing protein [Pseudobacteroides cellulosolvens]|uniref:GDYXXLXY protein n=1 Tax=Pseudobacteroides cellulosolvens ATCC 35603 = DSM 2933 TaxID=398512 RepID=A0A0L6JW32_9FIRM|nr:GDYXXLXY domain-containing protein [Pseudobacteroides cellulosolvens]KNY30076.1 GDYXXLXY protein [Pseudobacteroides cellulosolvens ATCC 35603 = DSM 2933]